VAALIAHIVTYAAVNAFLVALWVLIGEGSIADVQQIAQDPTTSVRAGFWPVWSILGWGTLLVIHAGLWFSRTLFGGRARRHRRRMARVAAQHATKAGTEIVREVSNAIDRARERRAHRQAQQTAATVPAVPIPPSPGPAASGRKWVTVMFSDIADSTKLNEELGDDEWHRVLQRVRNIIRSALRGRGGDEVGTQGDGTLARFSSPADAVLCAVDIQGNLSAARETGLLIPEIRIGVHAGEAVEENGDLVGRVINLASRVTDEAAPGEILVTEPVADYLGGRLRLQDRGLRELRGVPQPRHLLAVVWSDSEQAGAAAP
jgi:adenylate cyclase